MKQPARRQNHRGSEEKFCSYSVQYVRLRPILLSILLYHYKQLTECISEVEQIDAKVNSKKKVLTKKKEEEEEQLPQRAALLHHDS
jgi:hypothetical protein